MNQIIWEIYCRNDQNTSFVLDMIIIIVIIMVIITTTIVIHLKIQSVQMISLVSNQNFFSHHHHHTFHHPPSYIVLNNGSKSSSNECEYLPILKSVSWSEHDHNMWRTFGGQFWIWIGWRLGGGTSAPLPLWSAPHGQMWPPTLTHP